MSKTIDIALVTEDRFEQPLNPNWNEQQIMNEDGLLIAALHVYGLTAQRVSWSNRDFDWTSVRMAVLRTPWDYFYKIDKFMVWLDKVEQQTTLLNPPQLLRWNIDKRYLLDLQYKGVAIPATRLVEKGHAWNLRDSFMEWDCREIIIKPCVGGTARHTHRIAKDGVEAGQALFDGLVAVEHFLVQPFLESILEQGEVSLLMFGGELSHAVKKTAKSGDFRVQDDFGGTVAPHTPTTAEVELAIAGLAACPVPPAYARVDMIYDATGSPVLSELEMVEPELFFRFRPEAATELATIIAGLFKGR